MNILLTGGAGFIGSNLAHYLLGEAEAECGLPVEKLVVLDKLTYAGNLANLASLESDPRLVFVQGDIANGPIVADLLRNHAVDAVMHLAAESHVDRSIDASEDFIHTNVVGTHRLLEVSRAHFAGSGGARSRFLHVSTDEVYGSLDASDPPFTEAAPYAPNNPYSASKAAADHLARAWFRTFGLPVVTTNSSNNYGPSQFPEKLVPLMIGKALKGESLPVYGDGGNIRDWLHVADHCRGLVIALLEGKPGEIYAFGGRAERTTLEVVETILEALAEEAPGFEPDRAAARIEFVPDRPAHDRRYAVDIARVRDELGWKPAESFASGIRRTVRWYLDHPGWVRDIEEGAYRGERLGLLFE